MQANNAMYWNDLNGFRDKSNQAELDVAVSNYYVPCPFQSVVHYAYFTLRLSIEF